MLLLFSHSAVSNSLQPHGLQCTRLPCPSLPPVVCSDSCPLSWWYHPTISSSVTLFSSCLQHFPASGSFPRSWLFTSGPKYCSFSFSISPSNEYSRLISFRVDWFDLLAVQGTLRSLLQHHNLKVSILQHSVFFNYPWTQSSIAPGHPLSRDSRENLILTSFRCCWLPVVFGLWSSSSVSVLCLHVAFFCVCQIPLYSLL